MTDRPTEDAVDLRMLKAIAWMHKKHDPNFDGYDYNEMIKSSAKDALDELSEQDREWIMGCVYNLTLEVGGLTEPGALILIQAVACCPEAMEMLENWQKK